MARFTFVLGAIAIGIVGRVANLPSGSMFVFASGAMSEPIFRSFGLGRDTTRDDDRLERRDFIWTYTRDWQQNLCGDSDFVKVDNSGPTLSACQTFTKYNTDGYWLVTGFSSDGSTWKRFASVNSCVMAIRRTDGQTNQVAIGNEDVNDLMHSVISTFGSSGTLPTIQGNMTCSKDYAGTAAVEWKIFKDD